VRHRRCFAVAERAFGGDLGNLISISPSTDETAKQIPEAREARWLGHAYPCRLPGKRQCGCLGLGWSKHAVHGSVSTLSNKADQKGDSTCVNLTASVEAALRTAAAGSGLFGVLSPGDNIDVQRSLPPCLYRLCVSTMTRARTSGRSRGYTTPSRLWSSWLGDHISRAPQDPDAASLLCCLNAGR
jgi:hypothetical protein